MSSKLFTEELNSTLDNIGKKSIRRNREIIELFSFDFIVSMIDNWKYSEEEYNQYKEMIQSQKSRFKKYLDLDKYSRRLLIQFPADWYEAKPEDYMPCPESFLVQYINDDEYIIIFNIRSSEYSRAAEDVAMIRDLVSRELKVEGELKRMYIHFMNIHKYLDNKTSYDYDVTKGYFDQR